MGESQTRQDHKPKLMLISPMLHQGGFERVCVKTARLLAPYYEITIVIFDDADIAYDVSGLNIVNLNLGVREGKLGKVLNLFKRVRKVKALKKKLKTEITYSFGQTANLVNSYARADDYVICSLRSFLDLDNPEKISLFCRKSDAVACCSKEIEDILHKDYHCDHTFTLYNPIEVPDRDSLLVRDPAACLSEPVASKYQEFLKTHDKLVLSMGRQDDVKGFWHLVKAFSVMKKDESSSHPGLIIAGLGDFTEYEKLAKELQIEDDVFFPGVLTDPFPTVARSSLYVLSSYHEGFPNALLEAMAEGVPVIATDCRSGPREILLPDAASSNEQEVRHADTAGSNEQGMGHSDTASSSAQEVGHADVASSNEQKTSGYGILIPVMEEAKNLDASMISDEERHLAEEMSKLLFDPSLADTYAKAAKTRAADFSEEQYVAHCREFFQREK